jgi:hypothetical protein
VKDGLVMFTVRDKCLLGADKFLAEGVLSFADITNNTNSRVKLENMEQLHLKLNRPADLGTLTLASSTSGFLFLYLQSFLGYTNLFSTYLVCHISYDSRCGMTLT